VSGKNPLQLLLQQNLAPLKKKKKKKKKEQQQP
jgi:hypothetical protein